MHIGKNTVTARAAMALLTSTAGCLFMQLLLRASTNSATMTRATQDLASGLRPTVSSIIAHWYEEQGVRPINFPLIIDELLKAVLFAIGGCRSRSPQDFSVWVSRRVVSLLEGDGGDAPSARRPVDRGPFLSLAPKTERAAVLLATFCRLTPEVRYVLELRQQRGSTWASVAKALSVSVTTAMARHAKALEMAQLAALDVIAERLQAFELEAQDGWADEAA